MHESLAGAFTEALAVEAETWGKQIGPLVDRRLRETVHGQVRDAVRDGATLVCGGTVPSGAGAYYPATVLSGCADDMAVMREETFGPVAPVATVRSFEEALERAADSAYGLAATVLTTSMSNAQRAWRELPAGTIKVNAVFGGAPGGAAHPRRASGQGFGYGPELLDELTVTPGRPPGGAAHGLVTIARGWRQSPAGW